ncbi:potassium channel family protein [Glycomyces luteolus]|uniref:Potassium channel family protein n=1 Tax=Glycomyces luteolus TaxID=2670330 RepID=A0A9X3PAA6_9ACTN|nr:potassium channel family protein [Glycomyces luteolus]MDA1359580.1 potassium channel family protein [Glycomyces luteolus]
MQDKGNERSQSYRLRWLLAGLALIVLYFVVPIRSEPDPVVLVLRWCGTAVLLAGVAIVIRRQAVRQLREPDAPLGALIVGILAGVLLFALVDYGVAVYRPDQFAGLHTRVDALYFALSTLSTVGFGDVTAQGQFARVLVCVQMAFNVTAIAGSASLIARKLAERARTRDRRAL